MPLQISSLGLWSKEMDISASRVIETYCSKCVRMSLNGPIPALVVVGVGAGDFWQAVARMSGKLIIINHLL